MSCMSASVGFTHRGLPRDVSAFATRCSTFQKASVHAAAIVSHTIASNTAYVNIVPERTTTAARNAAP